MKALERNSKRQDSDKKNNEKGSTSLILLYIFGYIMNDARSGYLPNSTRQVLVYALQHYILRELWVIPTLKRLKPELWTQDSKLALPGLTTTPTPCRSSSCCSCAASTARVFGLKSLGFRVLCLGSWGLPFNNTLVWPMTLHQAPHANC